MRCQIILNAFKGDLEKQLEEVNCFISESREDIELNNVLIIGGDEMDGDDKEKLTEMVPTSSVIFVFMERYNSEILLKYLETIVEKEDICIFSSGYMGLEIAPRLSYRLKGSVLTDCERCYEKEGGLFGEKKFYSGHMMGEYKLLNTPVFLCLSKGQKRLPAESGIETKATEVYLKDDGDFFSNVKQVEAKQEEDFTKSSFVLVAGKGAKNQGTISQLREMGERIGASFGVSRPVAMNGWVPMERLVGASGAILAPKIAIVAGASGAPALYVGVEKSDFIIAINNDEKAPIIKKADIAVIGDVTEVLEAIVKEILGEEEANE
ncbi:electron transfer flavoprotein alpha subunit [Aequitasia blattaphilus]|uniref:FAD-binding protein n=1 Tax=Aequitasia blattaphilus TaxID=2949332 RepID=A0ABT1EA72_9FIRM|nr:FAD-binding protein [Aequitasia blattaphilus]MCP1101407.1 FAD-binding protein [Aequitasia blattaphilus]MCR8614047.1 FAD-binding protein [Aequitasia blattaphilus]